MWETACACQHILGAHEMSKLYLQIEILCSQCFLKYNNVTFNQETYNTVVFKQAPCTFEVLFEGNYHATPKNSRMFM